MRAELAPNEALRLAALARYNILDTPPEPEFDAIVSLAASICHTPISVVNLIDKGRQWFKAEIGLNVRETPLEPSLCAHVILQKELFVVPDTTKDPRFADNPLVLDDPKLRFYAGCLLVSDDGYPLGTLCVLDLQPRTLDEFQQKALRTLATHVMHLLELRIARQREAALAEELALALERHHRLLSVVSHDLRTPIQTIDLTAADMGSRPLTYVESKALGERLKRAARSMSLMVEDLADYESLQAGTLSLNRRRVSVKSLLEGVLDVFEPICAAKRIGLDLKLSNSISEIDCDPVRVTQVLSNLLQNAVKFTAGYGQIAVIVEHDGNEVRISVCDTGVGIEKAAIPYLFDLRRRGADREMNERGTGLGLSIVKGLVDAHHGRVEVDSTPAKGSTFSVVLPAS